MSRRIRKVGKRDGKRGRRARMSKKEFEAARRPCHSGDPEHFDTDSEPPFYPWKSRWHAGFLPDVCSCCEEALFIQQVCGEHQGRVCINCIADDRECLVAGTSVIICKYCLWQSLKHRYSTKRHAVRRGFEYPPEFKRAVRHGWRSLPTLADRLPGWAERARYDGSHEFGKRQIIDTMRGDVARHFTLADIIAECPYMRPRIPGMKKHIIPEMTELVAEGHVECVTRKTYKIADL